VEARQESFLYCCGGAVVARVECVAGAAIQQSCTVLQKCA
jgi:hypothetical protein